MTARAVKVCPRVVKSNQRGVVVLPGSVIASSTTLWGLHVLSYVQWGGNRRNRHISRELESNFLENCGCKSEYL